MRNSLGAFGIALGCALSLVFAAGALAAGTPPVIDGRSVNVGPGVTILEADVDPGGLDTTYQFELTFHYPCFDSSPPCLIPQTLIPLPAGQLQASDTAQHVSLDLASAGLTLESGTYEYALSATNSAGSSWSPFEPFTAIAPSDAPLPAAEPQEGPTGLWVPAPPSSPAPKPPPPPEPPAPLQVRRVPKAAPCRRPPRAAPHRRHRRHRRGIGKACSWG